MNEKNTVGEVPWLDFILTEETMNYLWDNINGQQTLVKDLLAGNISKSCFIRDKDNWFYDHIIKQFSEALYFKNWNDYYNVHVSKNRPPPEFVLKEMWVNYQKQHEFNPPHIHNGGTGYSFVIFMKIPTHWKEQHALPWLKNSKTPIASNFQFLVGLDTGRVDTYSIPLSPEDEGRMLFFPAWLSHEVLPFYDTEEERITISGNVIIEDLTEIHLTDIVELEKKIKSSTKYLKKLKKIRELGGRK